MIRKLRTYALRHRVGLLVGVVMAALSLNVWVQDGLKAFLVVLVAVVGCGAVMVGVAIVTGAGAAAHSKREAQAIQSGRHPMKELMK